MGLWQSFSSSSVYNNSRSLETNSSTAVYCFKGQRSQQLAGHSLPSCHCHRYTFFSAFDFLTFGRPLASALGRSLCSEGLYDFISPLLRVFQIISSGSHYSPKCFCPAAVKSSTTDVMNDSPESFCLPLRLRLLALTRRTAAPHFSRYNRVIYFLLLRDARPFCF